VVFGSGRATSKKVGIEEIKKRSEKLPGVGKYEKDLSFGTTGEKYTFGMNVGKGLDKKALYKAGNMPGPGRYQSVKNKVMRRSENYGFGRANDRFHCAPTKHRVEPGPTTYSPKVGVTINYLDKRHNTFGRNKLDIVS